MHYTTFMAFQNQSLRIIAAVATAFAWCASAVHADEVYRDISCAAGEYVEVAIGKDNGRHSFETGASISGNRNSNGEGKATWGMEWVDSSGQVLRRVGLHWGNECLGDPFDRRFLRVTVDSVSTDGRPHQLLCHDFYDGVDLYGGLNTLSVEESGEGGMSIWVGNDLEYYAGACGAVKGASAVRIGGNRKMKIRYAAYRYRPEPSLLLCTDWTEASVGDYLSGKGPDGIEGIWDFLDRDNDARWAQPGGAYRLAVVKHSGNEPGSPAYDILYLGGGRVNAESWQPCMLKGRLYPTIFQNHYNLEWYDAYMEPMTEEVSANLVDGVILSFEFPLFRSRMRFSRVPAR